MLVTLTWIAFALPTGGEHAWGTESRAALVVLALCFCVPLHRLAAIRVVTDDDGSSGRRSWAFACREMTRGWCSTSTTARLCRRWEWPVRKGRLRNEQRATSRGW